MADTPPEERTQHPHPRRLALRIVTMPRDTNPYGTVFGGVILSHIDQAGFVEARHFGCHRWVTASMERVDFHAPVQLGDVVNYFAQTVREGRSSVSIRIEVDAQRHQTDDIVRVTEATLTMVALGASGKAIDFRSPPTITP
ncbi:MAG: acyl-CoA thioesterase [Planctomycetota bacterium]